MLPCTKDELNAYNNERDKKLLEKERKRWDRAKEICSRVSFAAPELYDDMRGGNFSDDEGDGNDKSAPKESKEYPKMQGLKSVQFSD